MANCPACNQPSTPGAAFCTSCGASLAQWRSISSRVTVSDFDMPFGSMVTFMVKWSIASIPAFIILILIGALLFGFLAAVGLSVR